MLVMGTQPILIGIHLGLHITFSFVAHVSFQDQQFDTKTFKDLLHYLQCPPVRAPARLQEFLLLLLLPQFLLRPQPPSCHLHHPRHLRHHCRLTYLPIYTFPFPRSPPSFSFISTKFLAFSIKFLLFRNYYFEKNQDKDSISRTFLKQFVLV